MSSKLVRQQLSALTSGVSKKPAAKKSRRRKQKQAAAEAAEQLVVETNLRYFKRTKGPSHEHKELLSKVRGRGSGGGLLVALSPSSEVRTRALPLWPHQPTQVLAKKGFGKQGEEEVEEDFDDFLDF